MTIDWSNAPEGATHFAPAGKGVSARWFDMDRGRVFHSDEWKRITYWAGRKDLIARPEDRAPSVVTPPLGSPVRIDTTGRTIWDVAQMFVGVDVILVAKFRTGNTDMVAVELESEGQCCCFRADMVRTAAQLAAEERDKARTEILNAMTEDGRNTDETEELWKFRLKVVGEMLDLGYRKQVKS